MVVCKWFCHVMYITWHDRTDTSTWHNHVQNGVPLETGVFVYCWKRGVFCRRKLRVCPGPLKKGVPKVTPGRSFWIWVQSCRSDRYRYGHVQNNLPGVTFGTPFSRGPGQTLSFLRQNTPLFQQYTKTPVSRGTRLYMVLSCRFCHVMWCTWHDRTTCKPPFRVCFY
jgi:hypothetical protein